MKITSMLKKLLTEEVITDIIQDCPDIVTSNCANARREYKVGNKRIDLLIVGTVADTYTIVEVKNGEATYDAIGQVLSYEKLLKEEALREIRVEKVICYLGKEKTFVPDDIRCINLLENFKFLEKLLELFLRKFEDISKVFAAEINLRASQKNWGGPLEDLEYRILKVIYHEKLEGGNISTILNLLPKKVNRGTNKIWVTIHEMEKMQLIGFTTGHTKNQKLVYLTKKGKEMILAIP